VAVVGGIRPHVHHLSTALLALISPSWLRTWHQVSTELGGYKEQGVDNSEQQQNNKVDLKRQEQRQVVLAEPNHT
jgi:hypothetical protein